MYLKWNIFLSLSIISSALVLHLVLSRDIDGEWSPWTKYGSNCSEPCGGGTQNRYRSCSNPSPEGNGKKCLKEDSQTRSMNESKKFPCNQQKCQVGYSNWTECENCTITGKKYQYPLCNKDPEERCNGTEYEIIEGDCHTWRKDQCPSPCIKATCPKYAVCKDTSNETYPSYECVCTMGYAMNDDETGCIRPPPTRPTRRPIPKLPEEQKKVATVISKSASSVLIIFVGITLALFLLLRIFTTDRVIQMNMEIALISAHIFLMFPPDTYENVSLCKIVSILIHFFFTACFCFMMLEALHMYSLVAYVVKRDGMLTRLQNTMTGWGLALFVLVFCVCFEYDNYGGEYHCWLRMDTNLLLGQLIPIIVLIIVTLTLTEAAGADEYKPLKNIDQTQLTSAKISQRTNLIILPFVLAHMITGMLSEYEQNLALYGTFSILNGVTGGLVFFLHCSNNQQVRNKLLSCFSAVKSKAKRSR